MELGSNRWKTVWLKRGELELCILPGLGGRLWDIRVGGQSIMFQNHDLTGCALEGSDLSQLPTRAPHLKFPLWGGEKTWVAPQAAWPEDAPHRTLDVEAYKLEGSQDRALLTSQVCQVTGLSVRRTIELGDDACFAMTHYLSNESTAPISAAPWSVMMLRRPLRVLWLSASDTPYAPVFGEPDGKVRVSSGLVEAACLDPREYKVYADRTHCVFDVGGVAFLATVQGASGHRPEGHGALEVYNSGAYDYGEVEWVGRMKHLAPGEKTELTVRFRHIPNLESVSMARAVLEEGKEI
ncbi:hypothetical protein [Dinoroseobacter sp. S124A]|uniref:hypothetical protein n=1 Tax=Dinoroseobacter sp. S124A TaxID=3415128 RepID=UPI003C7CC310